MKRPNDFILETLDLLETRQVRNHIILPDRVPQVFKDQPEGRFSFPGRSSSVGSFSLEQRATMMRDGYTNHPAFEMIPDLSFSYFLKPNQSASKALKELITTYQMVVTDKIATIFVYNYAVLKSMIEIHGDKEGCARFDKLCGSAQEETPPTRRFKMINFYALKDQKVLKKILETIPDRGMLEPLEVVYWNKTSHPDDETFDKLVKPGNSFTFKGEFDEYEQKHPTGSRGKFECFVVSTEQQLYRTFGSSKAYSLKDLHQLHVDAYDLPTSEEDQFIKDHDATGQYSGPMIPEPKLRQGIDAVSYREEELQVLLRCPIDEAIFILELNVYLGWTNISSMLTKQFSSRTCKALLGKLDETNPLSKTTSSFEANAFCEDLLYVILNELNEASLQFMDRYLNHFTLKVESLNRMLNMCRDMKPDLLNNKPTPKNPFDRLELLIRTNRLFICNQKSQVEKKQGQLRAADFLNRIVDKYDYHQIALLKTKRYEDSLNASSSSNTNSTSTENSNINSNADAILGSSINKKSSF